MQMPNEYPVPVLGHMNKGFRLTNSQIAKTQSGGIAVVIHLFYFEEYAFILSQLGNIPDSFDLFVTTSHKSITNKSTMALVPKNVRSVSFKYFDNIGRDILPFIQLISEGSLDSYAIVFKLHTKRSPWLDGYTLPVKSKNGREWFLKSVLSLIGSKSRFQEIQSFLCSQGSGNKMIVPYGSVLNITEFIGGNSAEYQRLLSHVLVPGKITSEGVFAAGSMYAINSSLVSSIKSLNFESVSQPDEPIANDGTFIHAFERAIGFLVSHDIEGLFETGYFEENTEQSVLMCDYATRNI